MTEPPPGSLEDGPDGKREPEPSDGRSDGSTPQVDVVIVDDHELLADGVRRSLESQPNLVVVGIAGDIPTARRLVASTRPDVALLDYSLPSGDGIDLGVDIKARFPKTRVILMTAHNDPAVIARAVHAGLDGYIHKTSSTEDLVAAVQGASAGEAVYRPADLRAAIEHLRAEEPAVGFGLSSRELEVLRLMASGASTTEMSAQLFIGSNTTRSHVQSVLRKLGAHSKLEAVAIGMREGIVQQSDFDPG